MRQLMNTMKKSQKYILKMEVSNIHPHITYLYKRIHMHIKYTIMNDTIIKEEDNNKLNDLFNQLYDIVDKNTTIDSEIELISNIPQFKGIIEKHNPTSFEKALISTAYTVQQFKNILDIGLYIPLIDGNQYKRFRNIINQYILEDEFDSTDVTLDFDKRTSLYKDYVFNKLKTLYTYEELKDGDDIILDDYISEVLRFDYNLNCTELDQQLSHVLCRCIDIILEYM